MAEVTMPRLSDTMTEGHIAEWLKKEGDKIEKGDVLLEIETDKATMSQESYDAGILEKIVVPAGQTVPIGTVIAIIGNGKSQSKPAAQETASASAVDGAKGPLPVGPEGSLPAGAAANPPAATQSTQPAQGQPAAAPADGGRIKSSPMARKKAEEYGLNLASIKGTGPGGRILSDDVESAKANGGAVAQPVSTPAPASPTAAPAWGGAVLPDDVEAPASAQPERAAAAQPAPAVSSADYVEKDLSRMRQVVARRMTESKQQAPHIYLTTEIDMTEALKWRQTINGVLEKDGGSKASVNDLIVKAVAKALKKVPALNASFENNKIRLYNRVHVSFAVALDDGLITPVVRDADQKALGQIAAETKSLVDKARKGRLALDEYQGGTFTISNLGMFDVESFTAVINQPQIAILAVGSVRPTVVVKGNGDSDNPEFGVIQAMKVTVSVDHRAADGANGAQFLQELKRLLQNPLLLLV
jgi:pyruvate dehydrogenase E2 component (dihydrolipoamide acetyltransferase)